MAILYDIHTNDKDQCIERDSVEMSTALFGALSVPPPSVLHCLPYENALITFAPLSWLSDSAQCVEVNIIRGSTVQVQLRILTLGVKVPIP